VAAPAVKLVFDDVDMPGLAVRRHRHFEALTLRSRLPHW
jgi:phosphate butyryltransferase